MDPARVVITAVAQLIASIVARLVVSVIDGSTNMSMAWMYGTTSFFAPVIIMFSFLLNIFLYSSIPSPTIRSLMFFLCLLQLVECPVQCYQVFFSS